MRTSTLLRRCLSTGASPTAAAQAAAAKKAAAPRLPQRRLGKNGPLVSAVGLGCMSLSIDGRPDVEEAVGVIHAALDAGVSLFDTADVYCTNQDDIGANERLLRAALDSYSGSACGRGPCWCHSFGCRLPYAFQRSAAAAQVPVVAYGADVKPVPTPLDRAPLHHAGGIAQTSWTRSSGTTPRTSVCRMRRSGARRRRRDGRSSTPIRNSAE